MASLPSPRIPRRSFDQLVKERIAARDYRGATQLIAQGLSGLLHRIANNHRIPPCDHDDVIQQSLLEVQRALPRYEDRGFKICTWVGCVARNQCQAKIRQDGRVRLIANFELAHESIGSALVETCPEAGQALCVDEERRDIRRAFKRLPADERTVLCLKILKGLSDKDVAERLSRSVCATKHLFRRARNNFEKALHELGFPSKPCR